MKKLALLPLLILLCLKANCQDLSLTPVVDERAELLSVVFNLAGSQEFSNNTVAQYAQKVHDYFQPYIRHDVISLAEKLRKKRGVSYDAVMSMAIHISIRHDSVVLITDAAKGSLDKRWGNSVGRFVFLLNDFYRKSNFHAFFSRNKPLYAEAVNRFSPISKAIDVEWFEKFFGEQSEDSFNLVLSFINGGNFGPNITHNNGRKDIYSIICAWNTDSLGYPVYSGGVSEIIVHELCHSFCNPLGNKYYRDMKAVADSFYDINAGKMREQAYGNSLTMTNEILVRASTIRYFQEHGADEQKILNLIRFEQSKGFIWIEPLVSKLAEYENNRLKYLSLNSFMPEIVRLQNSLSPSGFDKELAKDSPRIVSFSVENNSKNVDPCIREIIVVFDRPMSTRGISKGKGGNKNYPEIISSEWRDDKRTEMVIRVNLLPGKEYSLRFYKEFNQDKYGFALDRDYELNFRTGK